MEQDADASCFDASEVSGLIHTRRLPRLRIRVRNRGKLAILRAFLLLLAVFALLLFLDGKLRPVIRDYACSRAVYLATSTINDAVNEEISNSGVVYSDLIYLEKDQTGRVTALHTNIVKINRLKARVTDYVIRRLNELDTSPLDIPLGTISGVDLLSGMGPVIRIKVVPLGQASASFGSEFTAAGINQTRHSITMQVSATVTIMLPRESIETTVTTHVDVAETIIVGIVPESYTNVEDASGGEITDKIFNFADSE